MKASQAANVVATVCSGMNQGERTDLMLAIENGADFDAIRAIVYNHAIRVAKYQHIAEAEVTLKPNPFTDRMFQELFGRLPRRR